MTIYYLCIVCSATYIIFPPQKNADQFKRNRTYPIGKNVAEILVSHVVFCNLYE